MGKHNLCWACSGEIVWSDADFDRWWSEKKGNLYERSFEDAEAERALASAPSERVQEAIRGRMRLYDSQIDPDCIGTGYGVEDIITMSELEQLVGFVRQSPEPPNETGLREALEQLAKELESRRAKDGSPYECGLQNQAQRLAVKLRAIIAAGEGEER